MSTVYVYEHLAASGPDESFPESMRNEGLAMLEGVARDLASVPGVDVQAVLHPTSPWSIPNVPRLDRRVGERFEDLVARTSADARWLVIAPETGGILLQMARTLTARNRTSLGPSESLIGWASDKIRTYERFADGDLFVPTFDSMDGVGPAETLIVKPRDGCGSVDVRRVERSRAQPILERLADTNIVIQPFIAGAAVSVSAVGFADGTYVLFPPADQHMRIEENEGVASFQYAGGRFPSAEDHDRIQVIARQVFDRIRPWTGYISMDMVVPPAGNPVVVEVNPRLTTSYLGLRAWLAPFLNARELGSIMLGQPPESGSRIEERWRSRNHPAVDFEIDGAICAATDS